MRLTLLTLCSILGSAAAQAHEANKSAAAVQLAGVRATHAITTTIPTPFIDGEYIIQVAESGPRAGRYMSYNRMNLEQTLRNWGKTIGAFFAAQVALKAAVVVIVATAVAAGATTVTLPVLLTASITATGFLTTFFFYYFPLNYLIRNNAIQLSQDEAVIWRLTSTGQADHSFTLQNVIENGNGKFIANTRTKLMKGTAKARYEDAEPIVAHCLRDGSNDDESPACYLQMGRGQRRWFYAYGQSGVALKHSKKTLWKLTRIERQ